MKVYSNYVLMRTLIVVILFTFVCSFVFQQPCEKLTNGNYKVELDYIFKKNYGEFEFEIKDSICLWKSKDTIEYLKIRWLPNCGFKLESNSDSTLTGFHKKFLEYGDPYYDIIKVEKDTTHFIYRLNLHVQLYSGRFIKTIK